MYDDFKVENYSKALLSPELFARHLSRLYTGDVIDGLTVTPGTGMQVVLAPGNAFIRYGSSAVASARLMSLVNNFNLAIGTADASNPRIDLVVIYIDNAVSLPSGTPTTANLDGKGVAKAKIVQGTPAATPAAPNSTAIQSSVGAGNPYSVLAQVRVNAGVSVIASDKITDVRSVTKMPPLRVDWQWIDYTPVFTGFTIGNGTINKARYSQVGSTVTVTIFVTLGSTSSMGSFTGITLPTPANFITSAAAAGVGIAGDTGVTNYTLVGRLESTTTARLFAINAASTYGATAAINSTTPFSWGTGDTFQIQLTYEAMS